MKGKNLTQIYDFIYTKHNFFYSSNPYLSSFDLLSYSRRNILVNVMTKQFYNADRKEILDIQIF